MIDFTFLDGPLGGGIKELDGLDVVAEVIQPDRYLIAHRPDIDHPTAVGELSRLDHDLCKLISILAKLLDQTVLWFLGVIGYAQN